MCKVGRGRLKPLQSQAFTQNNRQVSESKRRERLRQLPEAALRRLASSLRRQAWGVGCCDLSRPTSSDFAHALLGKTTDRKLCFVCVLEFCYNAAR